MDRRSFVTGAVATGLASVPAASASARERGRALQPHRRVRPGVAVLAGERYRRIRGQRVGLISNPTGVMPDLRHELDVLHAADEFELVAAFGPEHGFRGTEPPGGHDDFFIDPRTGIPVYAAYSPGKFAEVFDKERLDTVLFDIQDVGARFYTYIWTMYRSMVGAARAGCRYIVLDRPNPLGGHDAYGPMLRPEYATGVGLKSIAQQHGMTVGELAGLFNAQFLPEDAGKRLDLEVVQARGWRRGTGYADTGLPWVLPSPNMPTVDTATVYPGTCMFEGTNASEGRGTTRPFELVGAPYVDYHWARALRDIDLAGVDIREVYFTPAFSKWSGETCGGVQLHVTAPWKYDAIRTAVAMLVTLSGLYPKDFAWRFDEGDEHPYWIDKLTGSSYVRTAIDAGKDTAEVVAGWHDELSSFRRLRERYLLYR